MKVLLRNDVDGVGKRGDIVQVPGGFARNYLLPTGNAMIATKGISDQAAAMRRSRDLKEARDRKGAETQAGVLAGAVLKILARAGESGRLFGSVGPNEIAAALHEQKGIEVDRHQVELVEHIKAVGSYQVQIKLFAEISTEIAIEVTASAE